MTRTRLPGKHQRLAIFATVSAIATLAAALSASAQVVVESRTETITGYMSPIGASSSRRDGGPPQVTRVIEETELQTFTEDVELITLAFQIPDFDPADLDNHLYHVGMVSGSGSGSGTAYPDDIGYLEFELHHRPDQEPWKTFVYSVHVDTGTVEVFIDQSDLDLNMAVTLLTNLHMNANPGSRFRLSDPERIARMTRHSNSAMQALGLQHRLDLVGDYLSLEDLQEQIFQQTRCNVELDVDVYYIASCS